MRTYSFIKFKTSCPWIYLLSRRHTLRFKRNDLFGRVNRSDWIVRIDTHYDWWYSVGDRTKCDGKGCGKFANKRSFLSDVVVCIIRHSVNYFSGCFNERTCCSNVKTGRLILIIRNDYTCMLYCICEYLIVMFWWCLFNQWWKHHVLSLLCIDD